MSDVARLAAQQQYLSRLPEDLQGLGVIIRGTLATDDLGPLQEFLEQHEIDIPRTQLAFFRDVLILQRMDLSDVAPAARERLRVHVLVTQDPTQKTTDYRRYEAQGTIPLCRSCKYFTKPPNDGSPDGDKACVNFGTRGADAACFGYTEQI